MCAESPASGARFVGRFFELPAPRLFLHPHIQNICPILFLGAHVEAVFGLADHA